MNVFATEREPAARDRAVLFTALVAVAAVVLVEAPWMPAPLRALAAGVLLALPGYWCSRVLFPVRTIGTVERGAATLALSFATTMVLTLVLDILGIKLTRASWAGSIAIAGVAASWWGAAPSALLAEEPRRRLPSLPRITRRPRDLVVAALLVVVLVATAVLARTPLPPPKGVAGYTQLWLVANADGHELGIASYELSGASYHLDLLADDAVIGGWDVTLVPGQRWTTEVPQTVDGQAAVLHGRLYKDGAPVPYRTVDVRTASTSP